ncbi:hypothetical protein PanWU01x14_113920 [Parasponia andersonii]|uniref:Uncharacterized protein n=1 Tax=Parasponia andersonii TaxID=3476 RepID=A0A2P5CXX8_PARAD|nr:hypothetical protein PanWU01x14_113920 [Parasponia andersonii]
MHLILHKRQTESTLGMVQLVRTGLSAFEICTTRSKASAYQAMPRYRIATRHFVEQDPVKHPHNVIASACYHKIPECLISFGNFI